MQNNYTTQNRNSQIEIVDMLDVLMPIAQRLVDIHGDIESRVDVDSLKFATQDLLTFCERMLAQAKLARPQVIDTCTEYGEISANSLLNSGWEVL